MPPTTHVWPTTGRSHERRDCASSFEEIGPTPSLEDGKGLQLFRGGELVDLPTRGASSDRQLNALTAVVPAFNDKVASTPPSPQHPGRLSRVGFVLCGG